MFVYGGYLTSMLSSSTSKKPSSSSSFREEVREERLRNTGLESYPSCWIGGGEESCRNSHVSFLKTSPQPPEPRRTDAFSHHESRSGARTGGESILRTSTGKGAPAAAGRRLGWFLEFKEVLKTKTKSHKNSHLFKV